MVNKFINLNETELDLPIYRYLTIPKLFSMLSFGALWFPKLRILQDQFEGGLTVPTEVLMRQKNEEIKGFFNTPDAHQQIDNWPNKNVEDGRELTLVNCWFLGPDESLAMWDEYVGSKTEGVAVKSTIGRLIQNVATMKEVSEIGKIKYVDFSKHEMGLYEAHQACERAFIKDLKYSHEREVRISTMSFKHPYCVDMKGRQFTPEECSGKNMNNFDQDGLYILINLSGLASSIIMSPYSSDWCKNTVSRVLELSKLNIPIERSKLTL